MPGFFTPLPRTPSEAFLQGFKYVNDEGKRNSTPGYNLIKHNEELSKYILEQANNIVRLCRNMANTGDSITTFLEQLNIIIDNVHVERIKNGKVVLKNVHTNRLDFEEEVDITPTKTADIYRIPYKSHDFEKYLINGLNKLKKYICKEFGNDSLLIVNCELCVSAIHNYQPPIERVSEQHPFYKNMDVQTAAAAVAKEFPVTNYLPILAPK